MPTRFVVSIRRPVRTQQVHPDVKPGDAEAAKALQACQLSDEVLRQGEERREWRG